MVRHIRIFAAALLLLIFPCLCAAEFTVDPSYVRVTGIKPGRAAKLLNDVFQKKYFIGINNLGGETSGYRIDIVSCKEYGIEPHPGYEDIPDVSWIKIKKPVFKVKAGELKKIRDISIKIPKTSGQAGKNYQAIIKVIGEASKYQPVNIEVILPLWIAVSK
ncbi:MAG: hypothetical protein ABII64_01755 [Elusimicrobiota bacterium]